MKRSLTITAAAAALAAVMTPAAAADLQYATFVGSEHTLLKDTLEPAFARMSEKTDGDISWSIHSGGSVLSAKAMLSGIRDGISDAGLIVPSFFPSEMPYMNVLYDQMLGDNVVAIAGATHEMIVKCEECYQEWADNGTVLLATYAIPSYVLMCKAKRVETVDDIEGIKVNASGNFSRWMQSVDAVPVNMSAADSVEAIDRGAIDCLGGSLAWIDTYQLADSVNWILDFPMSSPRGMGLITMNRNTWNGLTPEQRSAIWAEMPTVTATATMSYQQNDDRGRELARESDVELVEAGEDWTAARDSFVASDVETIAETASGRGAENARRVMEQYSETLAEWEDLAAEIGNDPEKFAQALRERVYDRLDPENL